MSRFHIKRDVRFEYDIQAETKEEALAAETLADAVITQVQARAAELDRKPAGARVLADRQLLPGRKLVCSYKGTEWAATVEADGTISLRKGNGAPVGPFTSLARAAGHVVGGKSINAYALFRDPVDAVPKPAVSMKNSRPAKAVKSKKPTKTSRAAAVGCQNSIRSRQAASRQRLGPSLAQ